MNKIKKFRFFTFLVLVAGVFSLCFFGVKINQKNNAVAAGENGIQVSIQVDNTSIKTTDTDAEITVTVIVENKTGMGLYSAQATIQFDSDVFEINDSGLVQSPDIALTFKYNQTTDFENGKVTLAGTNNGNAITSTRFILGRWKAKVKNFDKSSASVSLIKAEDDFMVTLPNYEEEYATLGNGVNINFVEPSSECDLTNLTSTQNGVAITKSGNDYVATVPYSVKSLSTSSLKPTTSAGATVSYSPSGNVSLNEGTNKIVLTVTAEDGVTKTQVNLIITRLEGETVNTLESLVIKTESGEVISLDQAFSADVTTYSAKAEAGTTSVVVEAKAVGKFATISGTGKHSVPSVIEVVVTAENGTTKKYTINVTVEAKEPTDPSDPSDPSKPSDPSDPSKPTNPGSSDDKKEVDTFPYILAIIILGVNNIFAIIVIIFMAQRRKRK